LLEVAVAILLLSIGVLALAKVFTDGMVYMATAQADLIAKEKANEAVESVFAARDTRIIQWDQIRNVSRGGIFLDGPQLMYACGPPAPPNDGIVNTADDTVCPLDSIILPGPDGVLGTADDVRVPLTNFTREIEIRDVQGNPSLRRVRIIMRYQAGRLARQYILISYISAFS